MLLHGLQGLNGSKIIVPHSERQKPDKDLLDKRFQIFKKAG